MIALGLIGLLGAYVLLWSGFKGTDPRDEILSAFRGGTAPKKLASPNLPSSGVTSGAPAPIGPAGTKVPVGPLGAQIIASVENHRSRALGNWESDNAIDVVPSPNTGRGTPVKAVESGTIGIAFGYSGIGGYRLHLNTPFNEFYYAHFAGYAPGILPGRRVSKGTVIGYMGDTGNAKGTPHVHLASRNGSPVSYADDLF